MDASRRLLALIGLALAAAVAAVGVFAVRGGGAGSGRAPSEGGRERGAARERGARDDEASRRADDARGALVAAGEEPERAEAALPRAAAAGAEPPPADAAELPGADLPPAPWRGSVRAAESGRAVAGATVLLRHAPREAETQTDAEGAFALEWPRGLAAELAVTHPLFADLFVAEADLARDGRFALERSSALRGRVQPWPAPGLEEGAAAAAVLWPRDPRVDQGARRVAPLGDDGAFAFEDVPAGAWNLAVRAPGAHVDERGGIELAPGEDARVELSARRGGAVTGRVLVAGARTPVEGAELEARARRRALPPGTADSFARTARTGADGAFELLGLAPGPHVVRVRLPSGAELLEDVAVPESLEPVELELEVPAPARVLGRVVDASGAPVAGARVAAMVAGGGGRSALARALEQGLGEAAARADASGAFVLDPAPAEERLTVLALPPDGGSLLGTADVAPIAPGEAALDVLVRLPRGAPLEGRVLGADGLPPEAATVTARAVHRRSTAELQAAATDEQGFFRFDAAPAGPLVLNALAPGYLPAALRVEVGADGLRGVAFVLEPCFTVAARLVDPGGAGVAGVAVRLERERAEGDDRPVRRVDHADAFGRLAFERLERGAWEPRVLSSDWELERADPPRLDVPAHAELVLHVRRVARAPLAAVRGEVWTKDGEPLLDLRVSGLGRGAVLSTDGPRFEARGVEPGERRLAISAGGYVPVRVGPLALDPGAVHDLGRIELERGTRLVVRVEDEGGTPLRGARVALRPPPGGPAGGWRLEERGPGVYRSRPVPRGAWRLTVGREGFRGHQEALQVRAQATQEVRVRLRPR